MRRHFAGDKQRGIMLLDKHKSEPTLQALAKDFEIVGHQWGILRNLAEVPVFLNSQASRLIQAADLIVFSFRRHEVYNDERFYNVIKSRVERHGKKVLGFQRLPEGCSRYCDSHKGDGALKRTVQGGSIISPRSKEP
ncbi:MAG: DUF3800 domain-containing protein [Candidatus Tyrphobacter sp.]